MENVLLFYTIKHCVNSRREDSTLPLIVARNVLRLSRTRGKLMLQNNLKHQLLIQVKAL